jgi:hypothetical protein
MELKDVILSALAEMENVKPEKNIVDNLKSIQGIKAKGEKEHKDSKVEPRSESYIEDSSDCESEQTLSSELLFLKSIRERLLVLFEGFQAPNNTNIEAKIDMTLNFLEYVLVTIDSRVEEIERGNRK